MQNAKPLVLVLVLALAAAASSAARAETLFEALGGADTLARIVDDMVDHVLTDARLADSFDNIAIPRLKERLYQEICVVADGPCVYEGRPMKAAHKGLEIRVAHFNAVVENLQGAMDRARVPFRTQNRLLARLAPFQRDIVTR